MRLLNKQIGASVVAVFVCTFSGAATDMESNVRNYHRYGDWLAFEFRDPNFGAFLVSRAATTDSRSKVTLNITFGIVAKKCHETIDFVADTGSPNQEDIKDSSYIEVQSDDKQTKTISVNIEGTSGDHFVGISPTDKLDPVDIIGKRETTVNIRGFGIAEFRMQHAVEAIRAAKADCENYIVR